MRPPLDESFQHCEALARRTGRNFYYSFLSLPHDRFRDMCAVYAFMRLTDDIGDAPGIPPGERLLQLHEWRAQLVDVFDGGPTDSPVLTALADVRERHEVPAEYFETVIDGVQADLTPRTFETFDDLQTYCYQVAGVVGLCCIHVWGFNDDRAIARAIDCGLAFQLTNILRDLREDSEMGRIYLPQEDLARFDYTAADIAAGVRDERFHALMQFQVDRARQYYQQATGLLGFLNHHGRPIFMAMLRIYGGLLEKIEATGFDVYTQRVTLSKPRKMLIALDTMVRRAAAASETSLARF